MPRMDAIFTETGRGTAMIKTAWMSRDNVHRYQLTRRWRASGPLCVFIMLNPSTADALDDDPTIRRCIGFARREQCAGLIVVNLFAYRATKPADLPRHAVTGLHHRPAVGVDNDYWLRRVGTLLRNSGGFAVAAWGAHPAAVAPA